VNETPNSTSQKHGERIKHIHEPLMRRNGIIESNTRSELNQPINNPHSDSNQTEIQTIQQPPPPLLITLQRTQSLEPKHLSMKLHRQHQKAADEKLLHADTAHINIQTGLDCGCACSGRRHCTAGALDEERADIERDEDGCQMGGFEGPDAFFGDEEVYHACEDHVIECVDPCVSC
jgi:hypothetical protein